ncbi:hypothetical protein CYMTET_53527 [Cymbomonas tetramitiformis]|uniref:Uncharacterized protein n=1 Tax=Cymbomonas tetramitiformis TaxID=36881 RepID=A0AAE0BGU9_9CHLO|nr:hypothetical protein CYMTET_53527 [Cymbomonas tetramitiformis]
MRNVNLAARRASRGESEGDKEPIYYDGIGQQAYEALNTAKEFIMTIDQEQAKHASSCAAVLWEWVHLLLELREVQIALHKHNLGIDPTAETLLPKQERPWYASADGGSVVDQLASPKADDLSNIGDIDVESRRQRVERATALVSTLSSDTKQPWRPQSLVEGYGDRWLFQTRSKSPPRR